MGKRGGGITCALALMVHSVAILLLLATGTTRVSMYYSEAMLVLGGSTVALLGGLVLADRSKADRLAIVFGLIGTWLTVSWVLWLRNQFGLDGGDRWYRCTFPAYDPLPKPVLDWPWATLNFGVFLVAMTLFLIAIRAAATRISAGFSWHALSRRTLLIGIAAIMYLGFFVQSWLVRSGRIQFANGTDSLSSYWFLPLSVLALAVLASIFYLPRLHRYAWLSLVCFAGIGVASETVLRTDLQIRGNVTAFLLFGFMMTAFWMRRVVESAEVETACSLSQKGSDPLKTREGQTPFEKGSTKKSLPTSSILIAVPATMIVIAGLMVVRSVDIGSWIRNGDFEIARKTATIRAHDVTLVHERWGTIEIGLGENVPGDIFVRLLKDCPPMAVRIVSIRGLRPDIDVGPLADGPWSVKGGAFPWNVAGYEFSTGEISELQIYRLLEKNDVTLSQSAKIIRSESGFSGMPGPNILTLTGDPQSLIAQLKSLRQNKSVETLKLNVFDKRNLKTEYKAGRELLTMMLENSWGKNLDASFILTLNLRNWSIPDGNCPWESVALKFSKQDWQMLLELVPLADSWPIRVNSWHNLFDLGKDEQDHEFLLRAAIATDGFCSAKVELAAVEELANASFANRFERLDCVLRRDEMGNPVSLLSLIPDWLQFLNDDQTKRVDTILMGPEWAGITVTDTNDYAPAPAPVLARYSGLRRLGMGFCKFEDYSFLNQMPELRELQVPAELVPERQADLASNLLMVPKLEKFLIHGLPDGGTILTLAKLPNLKVVVLMGMEGESAIEEKLDAIRKMLPGIEIRLQIEAGFRAERPSDLIQHQKEMLKRLVDEYEKQKIADGDG